MVEGEGKVGDFVPLCQEHPLIERLHLVQGRQTGQRRIAVQVGSGGQQFQVVGRNDRARVFVQEAAVRLQVDNPAGAQEAPVFIPGALHTVRPIALQHTDVFIQNCREYTILRTAHFGTVAQIEVGALLVGKIANDLRKGAFRRGQEKGRFLYGGSTVVVLLRRDAAAVDERFWQATARGEETRVKLGERIGAAGNGGKHA